MAAGLFARGSSSISMVYGRCTAVRWHGHTTRARALSSEPQNDKRSAAVPVPATIALLRQYVGTNDNTAVTTTTTLDPVFVAVDVEAWERDQSQITEVGIATLDTRHLPPPRDATWPLEWASKIRTRHFLIKGTTHLRNKRHVKGCPDKFLFGESVVTPKDQMAKILDQALTLQADPSATQLSETKPFRNIVLVGHDVAGDLKMLLGLGCDLAGMPHLVGLVDTRRIARAFALPEGLKTLLNALGQEPAYLHNGGNDAHYTMQAALLLALYDNVVPARSSVEIPRQAQAVKPRAVGDANPSSHAAKTPLQAIDDQSDEATKRRLDEAASSLAVLETRREQTSRRLSSLQAQLTDTIKKLDTLKAELSTGSSPLRIYEKNTAEGYKFIGGFVSAKRAATFLQWNQKDSIVKYLQSGQIYRGRYRFRSK